MVTFVKAINEKNHFLLGKPLCCTRILKKIQIVQVFPLLTFNL